MRKIYTISKERIDSMIDAMKPSSMIMLQCGEPMSVQEKANAQWMKLGKELGFKWDTVQPIPGKPITQFTAEEKT